MPDFESALPINKKLRKEALAQIAKEQQTLDGHLKDMSKQERVVKYSALVFRRAAVEWLIATDQA